MRRWGGGGQLPTKIAAAPAQGGGQAKNDWSKEMSIHRETSSVLQSVVARRAVGTIGEPSSAVRPRLWFVRLVGEQHDA